MNVINAMVIHVNAIRYLWINFEQKSIQEQKKGDTLEPYIIICAYNLLLPVGLGLQKGMDKYMFKP